MPNETQFDNIYPGHDILRCMPLGQKTITVSPWNKMEPETGNLCQKFNDDANFNNKKLKLILNTIINTKLKLVQNKILK